MKRISVAVASLLVAAVASAAPDPPAPAPVTAAGWDRLKSLVGEWEGTVAEHPGKVAVSYRLVSNGTSLMETMDVADHSETMITMYAPDGGRIVATHYCSAGNQPRMAAIRIEGDALDFQFLDVTNVGDASGEVMRTLKVRFQDPDHFQQLWTSRADGKDHTGTFTYTIKTSGRHGSHFPPYTSLPSRYVASTFASWICVGEISNKLRSSTIRSAAFPTSIEPVSFSVKSRYAPRIV